MKRRGFTSRRAHIEQLCAEWPAAYRGVRTSIMVASAKGPWYTSGVAPDGAPVNPPQDSFGGSSRKSQSES